VVPFDGERMERVMAPTTGGDPAHTPVPR
jgi:hypothetical protein